MMRKSDTSTLGEAIESLLKEYKIKGKFEESRLKATWEEMMGKPIARRTEKIFLKEGVLCVKLNSAPLRQELSMAKSKVMEIIHDKFSSNIIKDIRFY